MQTGIKPGKQLKLFPFTEHAYKWYACTWQIYRRRILT